mmetsp:Transcript_31618/g.71269  ORF Transcript_31618/g.71269 Transcript_31618/m.71269 type:complete len:214 (+) Transcript_31618:434-1075(+)
MKHNPHLVAMPVLPHLMESTHLHPHSNRRSWKPLRLSPRQAMAALLPPVAVVTSLLNHPCRPGVLRRPLHQVTALVCPHFLESFLLRHCGPLRRTNWKRLSRSPHQAMAAVLPPVTTVELFSCHRCRPGGLRRPLHLVAALVRPRFVESTFLRHCGPLRRRNLKPLSQTSHRTVVADAAPPPMMATIVTLMLLCDLEEVPPKVAAMVVAMVAA